MLINLSEWIMIAERIGETKRQILESCLTPKRWSELIDIIKKSEPTLLVHVNDLIKMKYLNKDDSEKTYQTSENGVKFLELIPHVRSFPEGKKTYEFVKMVQRGIKLGSFSLKENIEVQLLGTPAVEHDKKLKTVYDNVIRAIRDSVTVWLPDGMEPDKDMYREVNRLIGIYTKKHKENTGKVTMMIEFDLPTALDMAIRAEENQEVRERMEKDREIIINRIYKNWHSIFNQRF
jgi:hypothetical protein